MRVTEHLTQWTLGSTVRGGFLRLVKGSKRGLGECQIYKQEKADIQKMQRPSARNLAFPGRGGGSVAGGESEEQDREERPQG